MTVDPLPTTLKLRILVGYLGERAQFGWWPTAFYEASSRSFLEPIFPKTSSLARYQGVIEAARRLHDEHLSVGSYHLFRLPEETEQDLHVYAHSPEAGAFAMQWTSSKETALDGLQDLAGSLGVPVVGPVAVGTVDDIALPNILKAIAAAYFLAFTQGSQTYPYMVH